MSDSAISQYLFQTGEQMGGADLSFHFMMEDQANVTQMLMHQGKAPVVPSMAGAGIVKHTARMG